MQNMLGCRVVKGRGASARARPGKRSRLTKSPGDFDITNDQTFDPRKQAFMEIHDRLPARLREFFRAEGCSDFPTLRWIVAGLKRVGEAEVYQECCRIRDEEPEKYDANWRKSAG